MLGCYDRSNGLVACCGYGSCRVSVPGACEKPRSGSGDLGRGGTTHAAVPCAALVGLSGAAGVAIEGVALNADPGGLLPEPS
jgi:hypothetical protein